jgi:hypothetical protein
MSGLAVSGLAALAAAVLGVLLLQLVIERIEVGAGLVFFSAVAQAYFIYEVPSVNLGGARAGLTDLVAVLVLAAGLARCLRLRRFDPAQRWLLLLGVLMGASLLRGVAAFGVQAGVADARQYFFFVGSAMYAMTFRPTVERCDRVGRVWLGMAGLMVALACARWLAVFGGVDLGVPAEKNGVDTAIRVLDGPYTFFLGCALLLTAPAWRRGGSRGVRWTGVMLLVVTAVLDRRTVWLAVLAGAAVFLLRGRPRRTGVIAAVAGAGLLVAVAFTADTVFRDEGGPDAVTSTGSVGWRVEGWSTLVGAWSRSPIQVVVGEPFGSGFGSGFTSRVRSVEVGVHPHNYYIETMIRGGLGGLVALVALTAGLIRRLWRAPPDDAGLFGPSVVVGLLIMQVVWCLTWVPGLEQGMVTGVAIACAAQLAMATRPQTVVVGSGTRSSQISRQYG